ncbi:MAG: hypothetical protein ACXVCX_08450, partial [Ktedonobacterales bacterium]
MKTIHHVFEIAAPRETVFNALTTAAGLSSSATVTASSLTSVGSISAASLTASGVISAAGMVAGATGISTSAG